MTREEYIKKKYKLSATQYELAYLKVWKELHEGMLEKIRQLTIERDFAVEWSKISENKLKE